MIDYNPDILKNNISRILSAANVQKSNKRPSKWVENNRVLKDGTPFPGPFSYDRTPYLKEIVDTLSPNDPTKVVAVQKGAQIGFSSGVIESGIPYIISEAPGNIILLSGHTELSEEMMPEIDKAIDSCGIRNLIRPSTMRKKNQRSGDTTKSKEFPNGSLIVGSANNHKLLRQRSARYIFVDDFDNVKVADKSSGSTRKMIEQRMAAFYGKMKLFYISTPEDKATSNIEPAYQLGDQRKYHVPCPNCGTYIELKWSVDIDEDEKGGITWEEDENGKLVSGSVGYKCQACSEVFSEKHKKDLLLNGQWIPTATPEREGYRSYHISALYAPPGMFDWTHYVQEYLEANPPGGERNEELWKPFLNLCLGETWEDPGRSPTSIAIQDNTRNYEIGTVPESLSEKDGNGKIVLLTCAADLNGKVEDARLDWEIVAWSENGASYSVDHGWIGTFIKAENQKRYKVDRARWSYYDNKDNSVWPYFDQLLEQVYETDTGRRMKILKAGIDAPSHFAKQAYAYLDRTNNHVVGLKGKEDASYVDVARDVSNFQRSKERADLYLVRVNKIKDELAQAMELKWDQGNDSVQPSGFMNFPEPIGGKYNYKNFFSHFESERRVVRANKQGTNSSMRWEKKNSAVENHFWDVRVYNMAMRDIVVSWACSQAGYKHYGWKDFVDLAMRR